VVNRGVHIPTRLPAVLARLGQTPRAETLARLIKEPTNSRTAACFAVDPAREPDRWPQVERRLQNLAARPRSTPARRVAADVRTITDDRQRAAAVTRLFEILVDAGLLRLAERYVADTADPDEQAAAMACVLRTMIAAGCRRGAKGLLARAESLVAGIDDPERQAQAQGVRATALARHRRRAAAETAARSITAPRWFAPALMAVAVYGPAKRRDALISEAAAAAEAAPTAEARTRALTSMCVTAAEAGHYPLAKKLLPRLTEDHQRDHTRFVMATAVAELGNADLAVTIARTIQNGFRKARTLAGLVPQVAAANSTLAQNMIGEITYEKQRLLAATSLLRALLTALPGSTDPQEALDVATSLLPDPEQHVELVAGCLPVVGGRARARLVSRAEDMIAGLGDDAGRTCPDRSGRGRRHGGRPHARGGARRPRREPGPVGAAATARGPGCDRGDPGDGTGGSRPGA
jgi:hypothetical protein